MGKSAVKPNRLLFFFKVKTSTCIPLHLPCSVGPEPLVPFQQLLPEQRASLQG